MKQNNRPQTGISALQWAVSFLTKKGMPREQAVNESRLLLAKTLKITTLQVVTEKEKILTREEWEEFSRCIERRADDEPLQYITGEQEFMGLIFRVTPDVLIPRWDTEVLVNAAINCIKDMTDPTLLDLCTGSGAIALSLLHYSPGAQAWAVDISPAALAVAAENAARLGVEKRVAFLQGDLFEPLLKQKLKQEQKHLFDLIVSNPPYISAAEWEELPADVRREPALALRGGRDGLDFYRRIAAGAREFLKPGRVLLLEIGWSQGEAVTQILRAHGFINIAVIPDLQGKDRVVSAQNMVY